MTLKKEFVLEVKWKMGGYMGKRHLARNKWQPQHTMSAHLYQAQGRALNEAGGRGCAPSAAVCKGVRLSSLIFPTLSPPLLASKWSIAA